MEVRKTLSLAVFVLGALVGTLSAASPIVGKWTATWDTEGGTRTNEWIVSESDGAITVEIDGNQFKGTFAGNELTFEGKFYSAEAGYSSTLKVKGALEGDLLKGSGTWDAYSMTFEAKRSQ